MQNAELMYYIVRSVVQILLNSQAHESIVE